MKATRFLTLISLLVASTGLAQVTPAVYVTFDKSDNLSPQKRKELADSARDLRDHLEKRDRVKPAEAERDADVLVTILDRRLEVNPSGTNEWGGALTQTHYQSRYIVFFRFENEQTREESEIALAGAFVTWKRVAGVLAKDVEQWAQDHRRY